MTQPIIQRGDIWWVSLDPTQGAEIRKTRPCMVLSHNTLNRLRRTVVVVPLSTTAQTHPPIAVRVTCQGRVAAAIVDQVRAVAKDRLKSRIESAVPGDLEAIASALSTILQLD